jgi:ABC-type oligopeptide transport system substrate-binding subunit
MPRRLWTGVGALALGLALLAAAQLASASSGFKQDGTLQVGMTGASVQIDPQLAYVSTAWWLEYATAAKLFNYPARAGPAGGVLRPEVASSYSVSRDGRTYTFTIREHLHFSDGAPVNAMSFSYAIDRLANHALASPGAAFITDPNGTNIVGAKAVSDGRAVHVRGVVARGHRLLIHLTRRDPTLLTKLAMPFFQATSRKLPLTKEKVASYPSAGPYAFIRNVPGVVTELRRNWHYQGSRPHRLDGVKVHWNLNEQAGYQQVVVGKLDVGPLPDAEAKAVAERYGVNKTRFWVEPLNCLGYIAFNASRPQFARNLALRRALNWAVDRRAALAFAPPYSGSPWTHLLLPGSPGSVVAARHEPYAGAPNLSKARRLAAGHIRPGTVNVGYRSSISSGLGQAQLVRSALIAIGFKEDDVKLKGFNGADLYIVLGKRNGDLDLGVGLGWCGDYPDPLGPFGAGLAYLRANEPGAAKYRSKLEAAERLHGAARSKALGALDLAIMNGLAPVVVMRTYNNRYFLSNRVEPSSFRYEAVYQDWGIPALALK